MRKTLLALSLLMTGCVSHYSHSMSSSAGVGEPVDAEVSVTGAFMLTAPPIDVAPALMAKCPSGHLSAIETQGTERNWLGLAQVYTVRARARCAPLSQVSIGSN